MFQCCVRALRRPSFDPFIKIEVTFTDVDGKIEGAMDVGGPSREFFRIIFNYLENSNLFTGRNKKYISLNASSLENKLYFEAGRILSLGIVHAGLGPRFFQKLYSVL